jgi:hypothetical protein
MTLAVRARMNSYNFHRPHTHGGTGKPILEQALIDWLASAS